MISNKTFYRKKNTQHCFLNDAISQIENDDPETTDIVMIEPPTTVEVKIAIWKVKMKRFWMQQVCQMRLLEK